MVPFTFWLYMRLELVGKVVKHKIPQTNGVQTVWQGTVCQESRVRQEFMILLTYY